MIAETTDTKYFYVSFNLGNGSSENSLNGFGVKFDPKVASRVLHITKLYAELLPLFIKTESSLESKRPQILNV